MSYRTFRDEIEDMPHAGYMNDGYVWRIEAAEIAARADARIAELECEIAKLDTQWRDELRIYQESADARIAELVDLLAECRDCVLDCHNAEVMTRHSRAERAHYYAGLVSQVDSVLARAGGGESG